MLKKEYLIYKLSEAAREACKIDNELFPMYNVKRGLRNEDGSGVLVGLTQVGNVVGYERLPEGGLKAIPGKLFYRGYDVEDLARDFIKEKRFGFEEVAYLLLSGKLPDKEELSAFKELLNDNMPLEQKTKMNILDLEGQNIMNILARSVLEMYTFDANPDDTSRDNLMRQSIELISKFPTIIAYAYNIYRHSTQGRSLHIRHPHENLSIAENFLHMLKRDFTDLDARTLDLLLVLQAEHGGCNNSTFTVRVTSSTGTDTYSSIAAGIGSLKGPLHGGANIQVVDMFHHLKENIADWKNVDEIDIESGPHDRVLCPDCKRLCEHRCHSRSLGGHGRNDRPDDSGKDRCGSQESRQCSGPLSFPLHRRNDGDYLLGGRKGRSRCP